MKKKLQKMCYRQIDKLHQALYEFVRDNQGEKGYIDLRNADERKDSIFGIVFNDYDFHSLEEVQIQAIRYSECGQLEVLFEIVSLHTRVVWSEDDIRDAKDDEWEILRDGDVVNFVPTLYSIVEYIEEYV